MSEQDQFDNRPDQQTGKTDVDYEEKHSSPRPGESEYVPEDMSGLGPVGYRRSDEDVIHEVKQKLGKQPGINSSRIDASIKDGIIILNGAVKNEDQKQLAEKAVLQVPGVVRVDNNLHIDEDIRGGSV